MKTLKPNVLSNGIWPVYQTGIYYSEGDIFKTNSTPTWGVWEVTTAGIGDLEPAGAIEGSVVTTGGITCKLTKLGSGSGGGSGVTIEDWAPSVEYKTGDFVIYINYLYRARRDNIKTAFDEADWQLIGSEAKTTANAPAWETRTNYVIGDLVEHDTNVFICLVSHVSNVFDMDNTAGYWKAVSSDITVVGGDGGYSQVTKMNVTAPLNVNIDIAPNMPYCHPPVEVLKFERGATSNIVENTFDVAEKSDFEDNKYVEFDGKVHLKRHYDYPMSLDTAIVDSDGVTQCISTTDDWIDINEWENVNKIKCVNNNTLNLLTFEEGLLDEGSLNSEWIIEGSATISNSKSKFGKQSLYLPSHYGVIKKKSYDLNLPEFTIDTWVYVTSFNGSAELIASFNTINSADLPGLINIYIQGTTFTVSIYKNSGNDYFFLNGISTVSLNRWYHIALVKKDFDMFLFVDGILQSSCVLSSTYRYAHDSRRYDEIGSWSLLAGSYDRTLRGYIDEFRISDKALWTSNFTPPAKGCNLLSYLDSLNNLWGIDGTGTFKQLATNWSSKSDNDKLALLESVEDNPSISDLSTIGNFKVIAIQEDTPITNTTVTAIPKTQTVYPTKLIKTAPFEKLNSVSITATSSGAGDIKVAVTTDLTNYKVWDRVTLAWIDIPKSDVATRGMSVSDVASLTDAEWNMIVSYGVGDGIAFAYSLDITADTDKAEIDELTLNAEMRGTWNKAIHGTDYTYGYPFYYQLSVKLLTDGSYKINYHD